MLCPGLYGLIISGLYGLIRPGLYGLINPGLYDCPKASDHCRCDSRLINEGGIAENCFSLLIPSCLF